jgi:hypothetical protein
MNGTLRNDLIARAAHARLEASLCSDPQDQQELLMLSALLESMSRGNVPAFLEILHETASATH